MTLVIVGILFFVCLSAFFSMSEFVAITANRVRLEHAQREGDESASQILDVLKDMDRLIACILIGNNIANVGLSALVTLVIMRLGTEWPSVAEIVPLLATLVVTPVVLMFGEVVPKNLGSQYGDLLIRILYRPLRLCLYLFYPVLECMSGLHIWLTKRFGGSQENASSLVSREEFVHWVRRSVVEGEMKEDTEKMIQTTFDFRETTAREVMMPLLDVRLVPSGMLVEDFLNFARKHKYTRYPVYEDRVDRMVGMVNVYEILNGVSPKGATISRYLHPIPFFPNTIPIDHLLFRMQANHYKMVSIVDEYGGCDGIVTVEDIIEEIVGEIAEDHETFEPMIQEVSAHEYMVDASLDIEDLNDELHLDLKKDGFDTLAGYLLKHMQKIPEVGDTLEKDGAMFEIIAREYLAILEVRVKILCPPEEQSLG